MKNSEQYLNKLRSMRRNVQTRGEKIDRDDPYWLFGQEFRLLKIRFPINMLSDSLVELPGAMLIGISQGGMARSRNAQIFQLSLTASKASGNLTERMGAAPIGKTTWRQIGPKK